MAKLSHRAKKHTARLKAAARARRILNAKKTGKPLIPMNVLKALAALNLPRDPQVYTVNLQELLGVHSDATGKEAARGSGKIFQAARASARKATTKHGSSRGVSISHESCPASDGPGNRELTGMKPAAGVYLMGGK